MFGTEIHWTTFFYLLIDVFIVLVAYSKSRRLRHDNLNRFLILGCLFVTYNLTGGLLPIENFPGPLIVQYIITYGVAITMCLYVVHYFYNEYDITFLKFQLTITNITFLIVACFLLLFLGPYFWTDSIDLSRIYFTVPVSVICLYLCWEFWRKITKSNITNPFVKRRNKLSLISITCIALLPILTVIGDYQWLTFTVINITFYTIATIEIDRYLYLLENKGKMSAIFSYYNSMKEVPISPDFYKEGLTRREIEIALSILDDKSYKEIGEDFFIAESTVSKHASNIFKKTNVKKRTEFLMRFSPQQ
ncbi:LuxR family transcriptional regulator [Maribacter polysiphoniae]|uniref:LuxR family transcriptional regulator n=1 Tax=Maribacter polysiphoniae TaxID=429344 RepID=A0A316DUH0_9FLAO|nr:LuxR family transcriptional regulator [Maribacter polysiphoniae]PWK21714.1 regulatory LuxR family protein [Maribacter polysiphoniae]